MKRIVCRVNYSKERREKSVSLYKSNFDGTHLSKVWKGFKFTAFEDVLSYKSIEKNIKIRTEKNKNGLESFELNVYGNTYPQIKSTDGRSKTVRIFYNHSLKIVLEDLSKKKVST